MAITDPSQSPPRAPGRPRNLDADKQIVAATLRLLSREGYDRTSIEAVAAEAGVTRATVYRRYPTKADMVTAAVCAMTEAKKPGECGDARTALLELLRGFRDCVGPADGLAIAASLYIQRHDHPELLDSFRERVIHPTRRQMEAVLELARDRGEISQDVDPAAVIEMLIGSYLYRTLAGRPIPRKWPEQALAAIWPAVAP